MSSAKPKPPEIAGGRPLPLFPAMVGKTWYRGGGSIVVFVPENERGAFTDAAELAGYVVEGAVYDAAFKKLRFSLSAP